MVTARFLAGFLLGSFKNLKNSEQKQSSYLPFAAAWSVSLKFITEWQ